MVRIPDFHRLLNLTLCATAANAGATAMAGSVLLSQSTALPVPALPTSSNTVSLQKTGSGSLSLGSVGSYTSTVVTPWFLASTTSVVSLPTTATLGSGNSSLNLPGNGGTSGSTFDIGPGTPTSSGGTLNVSGGTLNVTGVGNVVYPPTTVLQIPDGGSSGSVILSSGGTLDANLWISIGRNGSEGTPTGTGGTLVLNNVNDPFGGGTIMGNGDQTRTGDEILEKYTNYGDSSLVTVTGDDYTQFLNGLGNSNSVTGVDYAQFLGDLGVTEGSLSQSSNAVVPEPAALAWCCVGAFGLLARRRARRTA